MEHEHFRPLDMAHNVHVVLSHLPSSHMGYEFIAGQRIIDWFANIVYWQTWLDEPHRIVPDDEVNIARWLQCESAVKAAMREMDSSTVGWAARLVKVALDASSRIDTVLDDKGFFVTYLQWPENRIKKGIDNRAVAYPNEKDDWEERARELMNGVSQFLAN